MTDKTPAMPELPEPAHRGPTGTGTYFDSFTADQMRAYALAALQSAQPAAVSDEAIYAVWTQHCQTPGTTTRQLVCGFARAIPALSPAQQAPEWDGGEPANLQAAARDADEWLALIQRLNDAGRWRFSQPDSRPKLDGCRAALSKILCAPAQQAVPMTCTWAEDDETGNYATTCGHVFALNDGGPADNGMKFCCYCGGGITAQGAQQAVPMTDEQIKAARRSVCDDPNELPEPWAFRMGIRAAEAHHRIGITAQGAQGAAHQATKEQR